jgi:hypothetical protein
MHFEFVLYNDLVSRHRDRKGLNLRTQTGTKLLMNKYAKNVHCISFNRCASLYIWYYSSSTQKNPHYFRMFIFLFAGPRLKGIYYIDFAKTLHSSGDQR